MKVYISLPIAGVEDTVFERFNNSIEEIKNNSELKHYELCAPVNIEQFGPDGIIEPRKHSYSWYMGQDIEVLLNCDAIYMSTGWANSKGCTAELAVANVYNIPVYYAK